MHDVALGERRRPVDPLEVHPRPVRAAEVADPQPASAAKQLGMAVRDAAREQVQVGVGLATDEQRKGVDHRPPGLAHQRGETVAPRKAAQNAASGTNHRG